MKKLRQSPMALLAAALAAALLAESGQAGVIQTYTQVEFEEPFEQFGFGLSIIAVPEIEGVVVESRINIIFETSSGFDASSFSMTLLAPTQNDLGRFENLWQITGADLGWSGEGTFTASASSTALAGLIFPKPAFATWEAFLGPNFGTIHTLVVEHDYLPVPAPGAAGVLLCLGAACTPRRRLRNQNARIPWKPRD